MKTKILFTISFIALICTINAQESDNDSRNQFKIGVKAGVNLSNVYDAQGEQFKANSKFGFVGGGFVSIPIGKYLGVQPELLFSQKGFHGTGVLLGNSYDFTRTTNYIDVPLLFAFKPIENLTIVAGPQYSYLIKQNDVFSSTNSSITQETEFKNDNIRKNILCFLGGADLNISNMVIGGRVGWDVQNNNGDGTSTTPRYKNVWYQLTFGIKL